MKELSDWIKSWNFVISKWEIYCQGGWVLNISSLIGLWNDLKSNYDFKFLLSSRINQNPIEKLFSLVRRNKGDNKDNHNAHQFSKAFISAMCNNMIRPSKNSNCTDDSGNFLCGAKNILSASNLPDLEVSESEDVDEPCTIDEDSTNCVKDNILNYIGGFIVRKIKKKVKCNDCSNFICDTAPALTHSNLMTYFKAECNLETFGSLYVPSKPFINLLLHMETSFEYIFTRTFHIDHVSKRTKLFVKEKIICKDFPTCHNVLETAISIFCKVRIHRAIKVLNENISKQKAETKTENLEKCVISD